MVTSAAELVAAAEAVVAAAAAAAAPGAKVQVVRGLAEGGPRVRGKLVVRVGAGAGS